MTDSILKKISNNTWQNPGRRNGSTISRQYNKNIIVNQDPIWLAIQIVKIKDDWSENTCST